MIPLVRSRGYAPNLPIVDVSIWNAGDPWRDHVAAQLDWAASEFGFFYVIGHGIDLTIANRLLALSRAFFAQKLNVKQEVRMSRGGRAWRGYFPVGDELTSGQPDLKEGLYFGEELPDEDPRVRSGWPLHGRNLFPEIGGFREAVLEYMRELTTFSQSLVAAIARGLHLGDRYFIDRYTGRPTTLFRIFNYPSERSVDAPALGVGEHTDYGLLSVLYQDDVPGLEVRHRNEWIAVPPIPSALVVNVGDMLERLTSGRYRSTLHRVRNTSPRERLSMPFFFDPAFEAELRPIAGVGPPAPRPEATERWDGIDPRELGGSYGDYLIGKVARVFPELGHRHLAD